ncbi:hypothetical protein NI35_1625 [Salmonella enterica subsp. enterica serovar Cerro]|nr:hypothetical protein GW13_PRO4520 [Salmonella enterica subsp. enterica serovar Cerro]ETB77197.1 hypothetical protein CFSAN001691_10120 [Salmonella enterica subsp. enterica serovar Cerro str. CFSAN001691]ETB82042.1 hypothetical protein CFSAN001680_09665 [Salmonella enterica subsp. enterica serovar Cerro str. CFSAN001680]ETB90261.1 hypothetical protein CFSAN001690_04265 [Salmonella enterica subsp. enterica serovar Cerro str. CFSAN001690]ETB94408.1 hypothetical protein CFSAN001674_10680 [Salmon
MSYGKRAMIRVLCDGRYLAGTAAEIKVLAMLLHWHSQEEHKK